MPQGFYLPQFHTLSHAFAAKLSAYRSLSAIPRNAEEVADNVRYSP